jgi:hypothetical protein
MILSNWTDLLIWCPSQCYLNIESNGRFFVLYLRWRHSDPWTADLIECDSDFDIHNPKYDWISLDIDYWEDSQLEELKINAIELATKLINQ